jgi:hypothetical protein
MHADQLNQLVARHDVFTTTAIAVDGPQSLHQTRGGSARIEQGHGNLVLADLQAVNSRAHKE